MSEGAQQDEPTLRATGNVSVLARAYDRILKVARTIADIEAATNSGAATDGAAATGADRGDSSADPHDPTLRSSHISEAIQYRTLDRKLWL